MSVSQPCVMLVIREGRASRTRMACCLDCRRGDGDWKLEEGGRYAGDGDVQGEIVVAVCMIL